MLRVSPNTTNKQYPASKNTSSLSDFERQEKRRLALLILTIALSAYVFSVVIGNSDVLTI